MSKIKKLKNFYKDRNVYITGITGYKGTWLALVLHQLGANVAGIGLKHHGDSLANLVNLEDYADITYGDIVSHSQDSQLIESMIDSNPDVVIHLASQSNKNHAEKNPFETFNVNVMGTVALQEVMRGLEKPISYIDVIVRPDVPENSQEINLCQLSENLSQMISQYYNQRVDTKLYTSILETNYWLGGGDFKYDRLVPKIVDSVLCEEQVKLINPSKTYKVEYVLDAVLDILERAMEQFINKGELPLYSNKKSSNTILSSNMTKFLTEWTNAINTEKKDRLHVSEIMDNFIMNLENIIIQENLEDNKIYASKSENLSARQIATLIGYYTNADIPEDYKNLSVKAINKYIQEAIKQTAFWYNKYIEGEIMTDITFEQINNYFKNIDKEEK